MPYLVVSRFFDRTSGRYIDPGQDCPLLPADHAARLVRARCLEVVRDGVPASAPSAPPGAGAAAPPATVGAPTWIFLPSATNSVSALPRRPARPQRPTRCT